LILGILGADNRCAKSHVISRRKTRRACDPGTTSSSTIALLSNPNTFYDTLEKLYNKYGFEIAAFRPEMRSWCMVTKSCKFTDYEVEMLYMLIREYRPQQVFEMAPNRGFSSHWILQALHKNDDTSTLHSFDIHDRSVKHMANKFRQRWKFTLGDYAKLYDENKLDMQQFDFIFIDALHESDFARGYCQRLLSKHKHPSTIVAIHDIVADEQGGGRESSEVYKYLALANNARHHKFTMSPNVMPNLLYTSQRDMIVPKLNKLRARLLGIVKPCKEGAWY
jgi:Predicted O-methyltransferase